MWQVLVTAYHRPSSRVYRWSEAAVYGLIAVSIILFTIDLSHPIANRMIETAIRP